MTSGNPEGFATVAEEIAFLRSYESVSLWKPQVVADNVLTGIFLADTAYRGALAALLLQESVEAVRRLTAVWVALSDRSEPPARRLRGRLPGAESVLRMADTVGMTEDPLALLAYLGVSEDAAESASELATFGGLSWFAQAVRCAESGPPHVTIVPPEEAGAPPILRWSGFDRDGVPVQVDIELEDSQVIALGDATGDFVTWAREFLAAYIDARTGGER